jgi:SNF2 family DNA or RNA helicase
VFSLLTRILKGTPLQNNKRELFNLLQFLDTRINAAELDEQYAELTKENLPELHDLIRPFFLRYVTLFNSTVKFVLIRIAGELSFKF